MSFIPFSGGKRVCIGKTFAEIAFKCVVPLTLKALSGKDGKILGEFADPIHYTKLPANNALLIKRPVIKIKFNA